MTSQQERDREKYHRKLVERAGASDEIRGPRLTLNPAKATVIVLPKEGRRLTGATSKTILNGKAPALS